MDQVATVVPKTPLDKVDVSCCVCGARDAKQIARGWDFEYETTREEFPIVRCNACTHVYLDPRPAESELGTIYPPTYYSYNMDASVDSIALKVKGVLDKRKAKKLLGYCDGAPASLRVLDVGCGDGRLLDMFHGHGVPAENLHGVELSAAVVERLSSKGFHGYHGRIEDLDLPEASFDLITLFQVIEHVADPAEMFRTLARLLAPGGVIVMETPNVKSLDAWIFRRRYWGGYHLPRHWNLFHKRTLERLATACQLHTTRLETFVCAVFWIYPFHHFFRDWGFPRWFYRFFWPNSNPLLLAVFTAVDTVLGPLGLSANLRGVFKKPA